MTTLLVTHPAGFNHLTGAGHPERPDRLRAVEQGVEHLAREVCWMPRREPSALARTGRSRGRDDICLSHAFPLESDCRVSRRLHLVRLIDTMPKN